MIARSFQPRHAAYRNVKSKKVEIDGIKFASPGEAERYLELCIGNINGDFWFTCQPKFELQPKFRKNGILFRPIHYIADFEITYPDGHIEIEDVKGWGGYTTPEFKLKWKLFEFKYPALSLVLLKRAGKVKVREALLAERERLRKV